MSRPMTTVVPMVLPGQVSAPAASSDPDLKAAGERHVGAHRCTGPWDDPETVYFGDFGDCDAARFRDALTAAEADADALAEALRWRQGVMHQGSACECLGCVALRAHDDRKGQDRG